ncbi:MAG: UPF0280 family protein [Candidatus Hecatellales archaeon]|nr:MAG: UPF0280 family protein [Candidatus Hecatellales archaeon]
MWADWSSTIQPSGKGLTVDLGPMRLVVIAEAEGKPLLRAALKGVEQAVQALCEISKFWGELKRPASEIEAEKYPMVVRLMVEACQNVDGGTLTPMAAVAGAISDVAAEAASIEGAEKVVVENRGDISVKVSNGASARVGVKKSVKALKCSFTVEVDNRSGIGGIATSGIGGMGFTKGIASAAVALAPTGALADACSTILGNASTAKNPPVIRRLAEELDPLTDLKGQFVTYKVGRLSLKDKVEAVRNGVRKAEELRSRSLLKGGIIVVEDVFAMTPEDVAAVEDGSLRQIAL